MDRIYMTFVQATTGSGRLADVGMAHAGAEAVLRRNVFSAGQSLRAAGLRGGSGTQIAEAWRSERGRIEQSSARRGGAVAEVASSANASGPAAGAPDKAVLDTAFQHFRRTFDSELGGFGKRAQVSASVGFQFPAALLRAHQDRQEALDMTLETLRAMAKGGMHDQLGGGFHRYSVDERWFVPHFEKMLYDQAQLAISYLEAFQITHDPFYAKIARGTLDYVLRDMTHPEGGFYSAEDADSVIDAAHPNEKGEGAFYIWSAEELEQALGAEAFARFASVYGVQRNGNVPDDPHGEFTGKNILYLREPLDDTTEAQLHPAKTALLAIRSTRVRPHLDDKILTAWNGLMISAFAKGAQVLDDARYLEAAQRATGFILTRLFQPDRSTLLRRYRDGEAAIGGFLDDYAFFIGALLDLYEADFDPSHIETAMTLMDKMRELFEDQADGALFSTAAGDSSLVLRMKDDYDGAEPSGNSVALLDLLRLAHFTDRADYREAAERTLRALGPKITQQAVAVPQMLVGLDYALGPRREVVIAGDAEAFLQLVRSRFLPRTITLGAGARFFPAAANMREIDGKPTAYVCQDYVCQLPVNELQKFDELLQ